MTICPVVVSGQALAVLLVTGPWALGANPAAPSKDRLVTQMVDMMHTSQRAVTCNLRTEQWAGEVADGIQMVVHLAMVERYPNSSDDQLDAHEDDVISRIKIKMAASADFAMPTEAECGTLKAPDALKQEDGSAKMAMMLQAVLPPKQRYDH